MFRIVLEILLKRRSYIEIIHLFNNGVFNTDFDLLEKQTGLMIPDREFLVRFFMADLAFDNSRAVAAGVAS